MSEIVRNAAQRIKSFVENPFTNLVKGVVLLMIGVSDASHTIRDDISHGHVRLGHGLIIIGLFSILDTLPNLIEGLGAWARYFELQETKNSAKQESDHP